MVDFFIPSIPPIERLGRYRLVSRLAVGGMAELFLAEQEGAEGFRKRVVVKRLLPQLARKQQVVEMFLNEARLVSMLDHPNVVQVLDLGQEGDDFYIAMEYLDGRSLSDVEEKAQHAGHLMPLGLSLRIVADACAGLDWAHNGVDAEGRPLGIVHRDFTPANIFVTFDGRVKVLDFGIAKSEAMPSQTEPGALKGKYVYMSPEMVAGRPVDRRADLFAAGVMLYEITTGRLPFVGNSVRAVLSSIALARPIPPRALDPSLPEPIERLTLQLLQRNPDERPQTAAEVKEVLDQWMESQSQVIGPIQVAQYMTDLFPQRAEESKALITPLPPPADGPAASKPSAPRGKAKAVPRAAIAALLLVVLIGTGLAFWRLRATPNVNVTHPRPGRVEPTALTVLQLAQKTLKEGKPDDARRQIEPFLKDNPQSGPGHLILGEVFYAQRFAQKAESELSEAMRLMPRDPEAYRVLGRLKTEELDISAAVTALERAEALAPGDTETEIELVKLYGAKADWKRQLALIDNIHRRSNGDSPELLARAALARYNLNDTIKAEADAQRALRLKPNEARAHLALGLIRYKQGRTEDALAELSASADADKTSTEALLDSGDVYTDLKQPAKACSAYREAAARDPKDPIAKQKAASCPAK